MNKVNKTLSNIKSSLEQFLTEFLLIIVNKVNKTLSNIKSSWDIILSKNLCDHCEQIEQNPLKY